MFDRIIFLMLSNSAFVKEIPCMTLNCLVNVDLPEAVIPTTTHCIELVFFVTVICFLYYPFVFIQTVFLMVLK
jgi:hypothetical protein